jgi:hypothetical protein
VEAWLACADHQKTEKQTKPIAMFNRRGSDVDVATNDQGGFTLILSIAAC